MYVMAWPSPCSLGRAKLFSAYMLGFSSSAMARERAATLPSRSACKELRGSQRPIAHAVRLGFYCAKAQNAEKRVKGASVEGTFKGAITVLRALMLCHFLTVPPIENTNSFRAKKSRGARRAPRLGVGRLLQPKQ